MVYFPIKQGDGHTLIAPLVGVYVPTGKKIPKDGRMTIAPYHDHVLRLHDQEMLLGGYPKHKND